MEILRFIVYISATMNLRKSMGLEGGINQLTFEIKPKSLVFEGKVIPLFSLYLQKGVQVLGQFHSGNKHNLKDTLYRFRMPEPAVFRVKNFSHATYTWNFYRISLDDATQYFEDSVHFNLKRTIELYEKEMEQRCKQVQNYVKDKSLNHAVILQAWEKVRRQMRNNKPILRSILPKLQMHLEFQLSILNSLDVELQAHNRKMYRSRSDSVELKKINENINGLKATFTGSPVGINEDQVSRIIQEAKKQKIGGEQVNKMLKNIHSSPQLHQGLNGLELKNANDETKVTIVNPSGKQIEAHNEEDPVEQEVKIRNSSTQEQDGHQLYIPNKRFSTLSDIVERSHEGSSTYDYGKFSSGKNQLPDRIDEIIDKQSSEDNKNFVTQLITKIKTLPYQTMRHATKEDYLRRAQTAQRPRNSLEQKQYHQQMMKQQDSQFSQTPAEQQLLVTSGDLNAKYIILLALLIIFVVLAKQMFFDSQGKKGKKGSKPQRTKKAVKAF